jgi:Zn-dependent protease
MTDRTQPASSTTSSSAVASEGLSAGTIFGVRIQIDWSLLIVFALVLFGLGSGVFRAWHPDWSPAMRWGVATAAAILFFGSVLVHELSHAVVARANGIPVRRITLFLFGGMAHMESEPPTPKSEFLIAIVGPLTSLAIGVLATIGAGALAGNVAPAADDADALRRTVAHLGPVATLLLWLGPINIVLGLFNLIPGFPLDGGRVLRSALWWGTGDLLRATRWASFAGRLVAWGLMGVGVFRLLSPNMGIQGLWLVLIGWFLNSAARQSYQQLTTKQALQGVPVSRVMWTQPVRVDPDLTLDQFVRDHLMASEQGTFAVEAAGALLGLITLEDVRKVPEAEWPRMRVRDIMTPRDQLATLPPTASAERALEELGRRDVRQVSVLDGTHLEGIVRRRDLVRWLAFHERSSHA